MSRRRLLKRTCLLSSRARTEAAGIAALAVPCGAAGQKRCSRKRSGRGEDMKKMVSMARSAYGLWIMARNIAVTGDKKWSKLDGRRHVLCANGFFCTYNYGPDGFLPIGSCPTDYVAPAGVLENASHRDGSIYKRNFAPLEPMMFSEPTDCQPSRERCFVHHPSQLMQFFSLKLAKIPTNTGSVQLYGYIAVRDSLDELLNYIVNYSRDDTIIAQKGSPIEMTGPKRGILFNMPVLVEFDMRIKKGEKEEDDLQLIDGVTEYSELATSLSPFTNRISGDHGAVDVTLALVNVAVEATVEVTISKVQSGFNLSLSAFVFTDDSHERIQLFRGTIGESCGLRRYVLAVQMNSLMHMKFEVGQKSSKNVDLSFKANTHGCACQQIMLELATISVKVTWSSVPP